MILSQDRQNHLIHLVVNKLRDDGFISYTDKEKALLAVRQVFNECVKECQEIDEKVKNKISSLQRKVLESDSEWQVLYSNYLEEEMTRRGLSSLKQGPFRSS